MEVPDQNKVEDASNFIRDFYSTASNCSLKLMIECDPDSNSDKTKRVNTEDLIVQLRTAYPQIELYNSEIRRLKAPHNHILIVEAKAKNRNDFLSCFAEHKGFIQVNENYKHHYTIKLWNESAHNYFNVWFKLPPGPVDQDLLAHLKIFLEHKVGSIEYLKYNYKRKVLEVLFKGKQFPVKLIGIDEIPLPGENLSLQIVLDKSRRCSKCRSIGHSIGRCYFLNEVRIPQEYKKKIEELKKKSQRARPPKKKPIWRVKKNQKGNPIPPRESNHKNPMTVDEENSNMPTENQNHPDEIFDDSIPQAEQEQVSDTPMKDRSSTPPVSSSHQSTPKNQNPKSNTGSQKSPTPAQSQPSPASLASSPSSSKSQSHPNSNSKQGSPSNSKESLNSKPKSTSTIRKETDRHQTLITDSFVMQTMSSQGKRKNLSLSPSSQPPPPKTAKTDTPSQPTMSTRKIASSGGRTSSQQ